jgi:hypothetical protein
MYCEVPNATFPHQIRQHEGLRGFYKGTAIPMLGVGVCVSVQFAAMSQAKKWFLGENVNRYDYHDACSWHGEPLTMRSLQKADLPRAFPCWSVCWNC